MKIINPETFNETFQYFDKEIIVEIIDIFINEYPERIEKISTAIATDNFLDLKFHAHSMKGVVANFSVPDLQTVARDLEMAGANADKSNVEALFEELKSKSQLLLEDLVEIRPQYL